MSRMASRRSVSTRFLVLVALLALPLTGRVASAYVIDFSNLAGANGAAYSGSSQGGFTITPTTSDWFQGQVYGNPVPSIYDGPVDSPALATISITDGGGHFTFTSVDYSSNNGSSTYTILGYLGGIQQFDQTGTLPGVFSTFSFSTLASSYASDSIDTLDITVDPIILPDVGGPTSINLDNIVVGTSGAVPDSGMATVFLFGGALLSLVGLRRFSPVA